MFSGWRICWSTTCGPVLAPDAIPRDCSLWSATLDNPESERAMVVPMSTGLPSIYEGYLIGAPNPRTIPCCSSSVLISYVRSFFALFQWSNLLSSRSSSSSESSKRCLFRRNLPSFFRMFLISCLLSRRISTGLQPLHKQNLQPLIGKVALRYSLGT